MEYIRGILSYAKSFLLPVILLERAQYAFDKMLYHQLTSIPNIIFNGPKCP